jgi:hypothetical protein
MSLEEFYEVFNGTFLFVERQLKNPDLSPNERCALVVEAKNMWLEPVAKLSPKDRERLFRDLEDENPADAAYAQEMWSFYEWERSRGLEN